eukprot:11208329-Lingulodinium_polyedra.AAC.1
MGKVLMPWRARGDEEAPVVAAAHIRQSMHVVPRGIDASGASARAGRGLGGPGANLRLSRARPALRRA